MSKQSGSLVWHKSGWYGRYWRTVDGVRKRVFVDLETKNQLIARQKLDALIAQEEGQVQGTTGPETFEAAAARVHLMRAKTLVCAKNEIGLLRTHVFSVIGRMPVTEIRKADVLAVLEAVRDSKPASRPARQGYSQESIVHIRNAVAAVFRQLRREGVIEHLPVPNGDETPECLPEAIDDRPNAALEDHELLWYLAYSHPRSNEVFRGPVRERQLGALLCRCVGGMRTGEAMGLTWARAGAEAGAFDAIEVVRYKSRRKGSRAGHKLAIRQLYTLEGTLLPAFLRFWWLRTLQRSRSAPQLDAPLFPMRRTDRAGQRRSKAAWAEPTRLDVQAAFRAALATGAKDVPREGSRRWQELFVGTEDRRPMWFHNNRAVAADRAVRNELSKRAASFTGHATGSMVQHYRQRIGAVDVIPVIPQLMPQPDALRAILLGWCEADGVDASLVFGEPSAPLLPPTCQPEMPGNVRSDRHAESTPRNNEVIAVAPVGTAILSKSGATSSTERFRPLSLVGGGATERPMTSEDSTCQLDVPAIPAAELTPGDLASAVDRALVAGDVHGARRLLAELDARLKQRGGRDAKES